MACFSNWPDSSYSGRFNEWPEYKASLIQIGVYGSDSVLMLLQY